MAVVNKNHDFRKMNPLEKRLSKEQRNLEISLDQKTGSELVSSNIFLHGYFSASIKLPRSQGTVGVVVAFDSMNQDRYSKNQDEVTFEILGNVKGKEWAVQTNVHGNTTIRNSTSKGREERYTLRFDPSADFHKYSIFWTENHIIFYVDDVPIRLFMRIKAIGNYFIASPMYVHGSIWDTSDWTTDGGKQKVDYRYGPFTATKRLKQLAQTITGSPPKNLGLDNSVSDAVKGVSLSSHLVDTLYATPPAPSPAPSTEPHDYTGPSPSPYANLSASYPSVLSPDTHHA
ncbi:probable xyloglucan endotransglucosylase/hydrolase protein 27 [Vitis vinifera]|nr:probable xyloglucan endotransglucosylase/hydrolase protein 27 [Vitis vinifera]